MATLTAWIVGLGTLELMVLMILTIIYLLLVGLVLIVPTWRICTRAGFSGALSLFHFVPLIGSLIIMAVLAFSTWPNGEAPSRPL